MNQKILYPFLVSFILLVAVIIINRRSFTQMRNYSREVDHTRLVITSLEELSGFVKSAQIFSRRLRQVSDTTFYDTYRVEMESIPSHLVSLKKLVDDNRVQLKRLDTITELVNRNLPVLMEKNIAEIIQSGEAWRLKDLYQIHQGIQRAVREEQQLLAIRQQELKSSTNLTGLLTIIFSISAIVILLATYVSNMFLRRRRNWLEGFLTSILNTSQNGIVTCKAVRRKEKIIDFRVTFANRAVENLLGLKPEQLIKKRLKELPEFVQYPGLMEKFIQVTDTGNQVSFEIFHDQEGMSKWLYVLVAKMEDGLTASFHDISDIKRYQEDLQSNIRKLEDSNKELEQYAYVASHDLQEPLRKIRTYADFLYEQTQNKADEKTRSYMEKILSAAERMSNLISDILSFSSLKREPGFVPTDLDHVLKNMLVDLDLLITEKNAVIRFDGLPVVEAIPLQMHQLFYNLINNALKFSRTDTQALIEISSRSIENTEELATHNLDPSLPYCEIILKDNGIGFNPEFSEQIFGLFKRLGPKSKFSGSGIGLALCRKVVQNHNGLIFAEARPNEGAAFHIILPLRQPI